MFSASPARTKSLDTRPPSPPSRRIASWGERQRGPSHDTEGDLLWLGGEAVWPRWMRGGYFHRRMPCVIHCGTKWEPDGRAGEKLFRKRGREWDVEMLCAGGGQRAELLFGVCLQVGVLGAVVLWACTLRANPKQARAGEGELSGAVCCLLSPSLSMLSPFWGSKWTTRTTAHNPALSMLQRPAASSVPQIARPPSRPLGSGLPAHPKPAPKGARRPLLSAVPMRP